MRRNATDHIYEKISATRSCVRTLSSDWGSPAHWGGGTILCRERGAVRVADVSLSLTLVVMVIEFFFACPSSSWTAGLVLFGSVADPDRASPGTVAKYPHFNSEGVFTLTVREVFFSFFGRPRASGAGRHPFDWCSNDAQLGSNRGRCEFFPPCLVVGCHRSWPPKRAGCWVRQLVLFVVDVQPPCGGRLVASAAGQPLLLPGSQALLSYILQT